MTDKPNQLRTRGPALKIIAQAPIAARFTWSAALRPQALRSLFGAAHARSLLAMGDQGIASLGNFATNILLARALSRHDYGVFGLILECVLFFNAIQAALVTYPLSVKGAIVDSQRLARFATASLALSVLLGLVISAFMLIAGVVVGHQKLALCASAALLCWQAQETLRRALISHLRYGEALIGDAISYLGQAGLVALLTMRSSITVERVFLIVALTSVAGGLLQAMRLRPGAIPLRLLLDNAREFLKYGRWQALNNMTIIVTAMGYSWALACFHGTTAVAELFALGIILKLTNPLVSGIGGLIVASSAKAHGSRGAGEAWRVASRYAWIGAAVLIPYFAILVFFPSRAIELVHGAQSVYSGRAGLLRLLVAAAAITYASSTISAYLCAVHESSRSLRAQMANVILSLCIGIPLMITGGPVAGVVGIVISGTAQLAMLIHYLEQVKNRVGDSTLRIDSLIAARLPSRSLELPAPPPLRPARAAA